MMQDMYIRGMLQKLDSKDLWLQYDHLCEWGEDWELNQFELKLERLIRERRLSLQFLARRGER